MVLMFLGFAGNGFGRSETVLLKPGERVEVGRYAFLYNALTVTKDSQKQMVTADVEVLTDGKSLGRFYPARWYFVGFENEPTTEVALRRGPAEDIHMVLAGFDVEAQSSSLQFNINPLVNWIWLGVGILMIGTIIALLPERSLAFATSKVPEGAVTTSLVLLLLASGGLTTLRAQHVESGQTVIVVPKSPLEKDMYEHIVCMCGTCGRKRVGECTCPDAAEMRGEIATLVKDGKDREGVIQYFVKKYGSQQVLAEPIDQGFNRLAWLFPYVIGLGGILTVGVVAFRWSRRAAPASASAPASTNSALEQRLDDELRDLD